MAKRAALALGAVATFARLYLLPMKRNEIPQRVLMAPAW
jgi:magnesium-protoporphyrin IX monomethyl ester (oxidative) cyclase